MTSTGQTLKVGDEVRVLKHNTRYGSFPEDGYAGTVTKVARKYATATYIRQRTARPSLMPTETGPVEMAVEFDMATGEERGSSTYNGYYVRTPAQIEAAQRRKTAVALLKEAGFEVRLGQRPDDDLIERLAATVLDWAAEKTGRV